MSAAVQIVEVSPRDGLQSENVRVATAVKLQLVEKLISAGVRRIEVASFVNPRRVPQMSDAEAIVAGLPDRSDVSYIGLCLNERGARRAIQTRAGKRGVSEIAAVLSASDTFGERNQGLTMEEGVDEVGRMLRFASRVGLPAHVAISVAFGCPYERTVPIERVVELTRRLAEFAPNEISLADTIGVAVPAQVYETFQRVRDAIPSCIRLRAHFHDTRNTAVANAWAAYSAGVRVFDASVGGMGGCPFAPGASGNVATEDLVYLMEASGISTGLDYSTLVGAGHWLGAIVGHAPRIKPTTLRGGPAARAAGTGCVTSLEEIHNDRQ